MPLAVLMLTRRSCMGNSFHNMAGLDATAASADYARALRDLADLLY
jgi:hypothetical protein